MIKAKVYTPENISEGLPQSKWQYRLLLIDSTVELVEAIGCDNGGNSWCSASDDILDRELFNLIIESEPEFYLESGDNHDKYVSHIFSKLFYLEKEGVVVQ